MDWRSLLLLCLMFGCAGKNDDSIVILSPWSETTRIEFEQAYRNWCFQVREVEGGSPIDSNPIKWLRIEAWDDPARWLENDHSIDLVLGGPKSWHSPTNPIDRFVVRSSPIGISWKSERVEDPTSWEDLTGPQWRGHLTFDDPRRNPITLTWAESRLARDWLEGYAELVLISANLRQFAPGPAAMVRGEADATIHQEATDSVRASHPFRSFPETPQWIEFASLVESSRRANDLRAYLQALETPSPEDLDGSFERTNPSEDSLIADLLGATLVDAHTELQDAWAAVLAAGRPADWIEQLQQPPPWPPASVVKMLQEPDGAELVDRLAEELLPSVEARAWLMLSWEHPYRPMDRSMLLELTQVANGRLIQEPRVRAWLVGEWRAWARQRYRWIAREAARLTLPDDLVMAEKESLR